MRRILGFFAFILIFLLLFSSCNSVSEPPVVPSETSSPSETIEATEPLYYTDSDNNLLVGYVSIDNYSDYEDFINEVNLPSNFIKYESISILGEFKRFYIHQSDPDTTKKEKFYEGIHYEIEAKDGYVFRVTINWMLQYDSFCIDPSHYPLYEGDIDSTDMRHLASTEGYDELVKRKIVGEKQRIVMDYNYSNIIYTYVVPDGNLTLISFKYGASVISIGSVWNYPDIPNDPISKLINIEDNDPAEIVASITKNINIE